MNKTQQKEPHKTFNIQIGLNIFVFESLVQWRRQKISATPINPLTMRIKCLCLCDCVALVKWRKNRLTNNFNSMRLLK